MLAVGLAGLTVRLGFQIWTMHRRRSFIPHHLRKRYRRLLELTLFVLGGIGIGLAVLLLVGGALFLS